MSKYGYDIFCAESFYGENMKHKIAVIIGSLRKESFNRKIALALMSLAPATLEMEIVEIGQLPIYNQDLDENPPEAWVKFREKMKDFKGVLFVTPEYNRSVPGCLKNAIDVGSRPYGKSIWDGKAGAVVSASVSAIGGFGANQHLRQSLVFLNVPCMQQPEAYIGSVDKVLDAEGNVTNEGTKTFLAKIINDYAAWVNKIIK
jgi:chromate reductase